MYRWAFFTLEKWHQHVFTTEQKDFNLFDNSMLCDMQTIQQALKNETDNFEHEIEFF